MRSRSTSRLDALIASRAPVRREDGWANFFAGFGVKGRDPELGDRVCEPVDLGKTELEWLYRGDAIAARAVDVLPDDATRQGWQLKIDKMGASSEDVDPEKANEIADGVSEYIRRLDGRQRIRQGLSLGRVFGGAIAVLGLDDADSSDLRRFSEPVDEARVKSLRWIQLLDRYAVQPGDLEVDPTKPGFGEPRTYKVTGLADQPELEVHASRVIRFRGAWSPTCTGTTGNKGWDDSVLTRIWDPLRRFEMAYASAARVVRDFSRAVWSIKHLHRHIASNREEVVVRRLRIAELSMSALNAVLLDPDGESFQFMQRPIAGLPDLLDRHGIVLAAATGMPITQLLGLSPGGFGTGEDEDRRWQNVCQAYQLDQVRPTLDRLVRYILLAQDGPTQGVLPEKYQIVFNPLRSPSAKETAEIRKLVSEATTGLVNAGVLLPEEVAESLYGRGEFSMDVTLDRELRAEREAAMEEMPDPADPNADPAEAAAAAAMSEQRTRAAMAANADSIMRIVERVHDEAISPESGARLLIGLYGMPADEAHALTKAA